MIGDNAFTNADVKSVYSPKSVRRIEEFSFAICGNLTEVAGEGVEEIEQYAFSGCDKLQRAIFSQLEKCYDISVENCDSLKRENIIIPDNAEIIEVEFEPCGCGYNHNKHTPFTKNIGAEKQTFPSLVPRLKNLNFDDLLKQASKEFIKEMGQENE